MRITQRIKLNQTLRGGIERYAVFSTFPARGLVTSNADGLPVTWKRRPSRAQLKRIGEGVDLVSMGIARVVRVRIWAVGERADDRGLPTYEVQS